MQFLHLLLVSLGVFILGGGALYFFPFESNHQHLRVINDEDTFDISKSDDRPVIGILTQPSYDGKEYIAASYVKFVEASGARVIPIRYFWTERELETAFAGINGLLFPGGEASLDPKDSVLLRPAKILFALAEKQNKRHRDSFFIFGTCLGWELLAMVASGDYTLLKESGEFDHNGLSTALERVQFSSHLFHKMDKKLADKPVFYFHHRYGVTPEMFDLTLSKRCWKPVAYNRDLKGKAFVAAAESTCGAPYFGVQFHPEKNLFEWTENAGGIAHSLDATHATMHFIELLARVSRHTRRGNFKEKEIHSRAIENFPIQYTPQGYFLQSYILNDDVNNKSHVVKEEEERKTEVM